MTEIIVPPLGESVTEATVGKWSKSVGEHVERDDVLVELETDKVTVDISADHTGILREILVNTGDTVAIGTVLGALEDDSDSTAIQDVKNVDEDKNQTEQTPHNKTDAAAMAVSETADNNSVASGDKPVITGADQAAIPVIVPDMGESVSDGTIGSLLKQVGDSVARDEMIASVETEKVALDLPASGDGVLHEWLVSEGDSVTPGAVIAYIKPAQVDHSTQQIPVVPQEQPSLPNKSPVVSPSVRRIATEAGINPADIPGTGRNGRATKADALAYVKQNKSGAAQQTDVMPKQAKAVTPPQREQEAMMIQTKALPTEAREKRVKMTRLRQTIARRLKESQNTAAMLTTFNDVDMSAIMDLRAKYKEHFFEKHGVKLGFMGFFAKAIISALKQVPVVNAEIDGDDIIYKNYYNIGIAVAGDKGLVVPVIRDCDRLSIAEIEAAIGEMGKKARDGSLAISEMQGASFTITNGGVFGSLLSTPILNPPQSGVLGMHRIEERPVAVRGEVVIRPMMYLALSYDHRIIDGKEAVTFLVHTKQALEAPERLFLNI